MPQTGHGHGDQGRVIGLHAGQRFGRKNRRGFTAQYQQGSAFQSGKEMPEIRQFSGCLCERFHDGGIPVDMPATVVAVPVGALGEAPPGLLVAKGDLPEGVLQKAGGGLQVGLRCVLADIGHDLIQGVALELGTDIVEDGPGQGVRQRGAEAHGEQSAERGAHGHEAVQPGDGQQMAQVVQILDRMVAAPVLDIGGEPASPVVGADHPAPCRQAFCELVEVLRVSGEAPEA